MGRGCSERARAQCFCGTLQDVLDTRMLVGGPQRLLSCTESCSLGAELAAEQILQQWWPRPSHTALQEPLPARKLCPAQCCQDLLLILGKLVSLQSRVSLAVLSLHTTSLSCTLFHQQLQHVAAVCHHIDTFTLNRSSAVALEVMHEASPLCLSTSSEAVPPNVTLIQGPATRKDTGQGE